MMPGLDEIRAIEERLIGAVLLGIEADRVPRGILPDDLEHEELRPIWGAALAQTDNLARVDLEKVVFALADPNLKRLAMQLAETPTAAYLDSDAERVRARARVRRAEQAARAYLEEPTEAHRIQLARAISQPAEGEHQSQFDALREEGGYRLSVPALAAELELSQLRRDRHQLKAELLVRCQLPGASTIDGALSVSDVNLSSARARRDHAGHLAEQARTEPDVWRATLEELAQRVLAAERAGEPDVSLHEVELERVRVLDVDGLLLPRAHPAVLFGDGDSAKSYVALYVLGRLAQDGLRVGLADWELSAGDHRERLGRLFPEGMPNIRYLRCARSITLEADRLRRWVQEHGLEFLVFDSVGYACAGAPESAEDAMAYFRVIRQLGGIGSLHIAHISKALEGADRRPFGSVFWHNSPRATWFAKLAERDPGGAVSRLALYPRKWNVGPLPSAAGFELTFTPNRTEIRGAAVEDIPELAAGLTIRQRMAAALRQGELRAEELAEEIGAELQSVKRTARRYPQQFGAGPGGTLRLLAGGRS